MVTLRLQWEKEEKKNPKFVQVHNIQAVQSLQIIDPVLYFSLSPSGVTPFFSAAAEQCGKLEIKMQRMKEGWRGGGDKGGGGGGHSGVLRLLNTCSFPFPKWQIDVHSAATKINTVSFKRLMK